MPNKMIVEIQGHAGGDATLKTSEGKREYAQFSIAVTFGKKDDPKRHTLWVRCLAFHAAREQAMDLVKKGNPLVVRGDMSECSAYINTKTNAPAIRATMFVNTIDPYVKGQPVEPPPTPDSPDDGDASEALPF